MRSCIALACGVLVSWGVACSSASQDALPETAADATGSSSTGTSMAGLGTGTMGAGGSDPSSSAGSGGAAGTSGVGGATGVAGGGDDGGVGGGAGAVIVRPDAGATSGTCAGDTTLPAEPIIPPACATLQAARNVPAGGVPQENSLDTAAIQSALNACGSGKAVRLSTNASNNAFATGPLTVPSGVTLWIDAGVTLYGTRDPNVYGNSSALITVRGSGSGIVGDGTIDGQGGEPMIGQTQSWWDQNGDGTGNSPALIAVSGATNFTLYRIRLQNSPKFHVKLAASGFVVWGVNIKTPSKPTNSAGTPLTPASAHNTDGIDPGEAASNGYIVCSKISVGDDQIAIKGGTGVDHLTIAHNHFGAGHGMSIGSEFQGGVSNVNVYDLSIDGTGTGLSGGSANGIRIKSDSSRGGLVNNVTYRDVCVRGLTNPIILTPKYSMLTGTSIPQYTNITIRDFHSVGTSPAPKVTLDGFSAAYANSITLDNVVVDGISSSNVAASYSGVTLGPGNVNFVPSGTGVTVTNKIAAGSTANACTGKWVTF